MKYENVTAALAELQAERTKLDAAITALLPLLPSANGHGAAGHALDVPEARPNQTVSAPVERKPPIAKHSAPKVGVKPAAPKPSGPRVEDLAIDALRKADRPLTWNELSLACKRPMGAAYLDGAIEAGRLIVEGERGNRRVRLPAMKPAAAVDAKKVARPAPSIRREHHVERHGQLWRCGECFEEREQPHEFKAFDCEE